MIHTTQQYRHDNSPGDDFDYPEPNYPYLYAPRSEAGYTTPAVSHAPLPPPSVAPSQHSHGFSHGYPKRRVPERAYSDTSRSSGGDSYITPSLSASQVGNRMRATSQARSYASPRSRATSFVSREDLRNIPNGPPAFTPRSKPPALLASPSVLSHPQAPASLTSTSTSSSKPTGIRRLRGVLKKPRAPTDDASYTTSSSAPDVIHQPPPQIVMPRQERSFPVPPPIEYSAPTEYSPSEPSKRRQSKARSAAPPSTVSPSTVSPSAVSPSTVVQKTRFNGNSDHVSRHLSKPWDARSPPHLDTATRNAPAFDVRGIRNIQLIVAGLPWSVHVRGGSSRSRSSKSRASSDITIGDVIYSVYETLNKSLTRTDVRAATNETKKCIARAAAAAERESQRGENSARTGKPSAARRIDYLGSRVWFLGLEKNDEFARREGYGLNEGELKKVWVMRFSSSPSGRPTTVMV
ncbi:unnamed protein product [Rhizoctonia solani]|uniref:DUF6699 domain-containing protein n=1 Tax=Rhizoctonia solani TaxID=456999 RepID=A0A8H3HVJ9_9AGAM|nr:unnamed protein product [Rhizoctonia solani]